MSIGQDINSLDFSEICRLCLRKDTNLSSIFVAPIPLQIMSLTSIEMFEGDGLPESVCLQCKQEVDRSYNFKTICENADATLRQCLKDITLQIVTVHPPVLLTAEENKDITCTYSTSIVKSAQPSSSQLDVLPTTFYCDISNFDEEAVVTFSETFEEPINLKTATSPIKQRKIQPKRLPKLKVQTVEVTNEDISSGDNTFFCDKCSKSFSKRENLKKHQIIHSSENKSFLCHECGRCFLRLQDLKVHMRYHSGDRPYQCNICKQNFYSYSGLKGHENRHFGIKPFLCNICGKNFVQKSQLVNHERTHTQEKPFPCSMCAKTFNTKTNLRTHLKRHSGVNEFACKICSKSFFTKSGLERHELLHAGHKPHSCQICSLSFFTKSEITRHMRYHRGEKRFECSECNQKFIENQHLVIHKRIHTGERPFSCELCKKTFYTKSKLNRHMKTHSLRHS